MHSSRKFSSYIAYFPKFIQENLIHPRVLTYRYAAISGPLSSQQSAVVRGTYLSYIADENMEASSENKMKFNL